MYQEDQTYDGEYEQYCSQAAMQAEYQEQCAYNDFLNQLIKKGDYYQYALNVAIDKLRSAEFQNSKLAPIEFF